MNTVRIVVVGVALFVCALSARSAAAQDAACLAKCDKITYGKWHVAQCKKKCQPKEPPAAAKSGGAGAVAKGGGGFRGGGKAPIRVTIQEREKESKADEIARMEQANRENLACQAKCDAIPLTKFGSEWWRDRQCRTPCNDKHQRYAIVYPRPAKPKAPVLRGTPEAQKARMAALTSQAKAALAPIDAHKAKLATLWDQATSCAGLRGKRFPSSDGDDTKAGRCEPEMVLSGDLMKIASVDVRLDRIEARVNRCIEGYRKWVNAIGAAYNKIITEQKGVFATLKRAVCKGLATVGKVGDELRKLVKDPLEWVLSNMPGEIAAGLRQLISEAKECAKKSARALGKLPWKLAGGVGGIIKQAVPHLLSFKNPLDLESKILPEVRKAWGKIKADFRVALAACKKAGQSLVNLACSDKLLGAGGCQLLRDAASCLGRVTAGQVSVPKSLLGSLRVWGQGEGGVLHRVKNVARAFTGKVRADLRKAVAACKKAGQSAVALVCSRLCAMNKTCKGLLDEMEGDGIRCAPDNVEKMVLWYLRKKVFTAPGRMLVLNLRAEVSAKLFEFITGKFGGGVTGKISRQGDGDVYDVEIAIDEKAEVGLEAEAGEQKVGGTTGLGLTNTTKASLDASSASDRKQLLLLGFATFVSGFVNSIERTGTLSTILERASQKFLGTPPISELTIFKGRGCQLCLNSTIDAALKLKIINLDLSGAQNLCASAMFDKASRTLALDLSNSIKAAAKASGGLLDKAEGYIAKVGNYLGKISRWLKKKVVGFATEKLEKLKQALDVAGSVSGSTSLTYRNVDWPKNAGATCPYDAVVKAAKRGGPSFGRNWTLSWTWMKRTVTVELSAGGGGVVDALGVALPPPATFVAFLLDPRNAGARVSWKVSVSTPSEATEKNFGKKVKGTASYAWEDPPQVLGSGTVSVADLKQGKLGELRAAVGRKTEAELEAEQEAAAQGSEPLIGKEDLQELAGEAKDRLFKKKNKGKATQKKKTSQKKKPALPVDRGSKQDRRTAKKKTPPAKKKSALTKKLVEQVKKGAKKVGTRIVKEVVRKATQPSEEGGEEAPPATTAAEEPEAAPPPAPAEEPAPSQPEEGAEQRE